MLYFAYGSNMNSEQMRGRCPTARFQTIAHLDGFKLAFPRESKAWGGGVASAVPDPTGQVWGVIYKISDAEQPVLDRHEGFSTQRPALANDYQRVEKRVVGKDGTPIKVLTYVANNQPNPPLPSARYVALLVAGAKHFQLPPEYIALLEKIPVQAPATPPTK